MKIIRKQNRGMTLVELMLVVFILTVGIGSTLAFFSSTMLLTGMSRDITVATTHGEYILEEMHTRKFLQDIENTNWAQWAEKEELYSLPGESIEVAFANPSGNPLDVQVTVTWMKQKRTNKIELFTKVTRVKDEDKEENKDDKSQI